MRCFGLALLLLIVVLLAGCVGVVPLTPEVVRVYTADGQTYFLVERYYDSTDYCQPGYTCVYYPPGYEGYMFRSRGRGLWFHAHGHGSFHFGTGGKKGKR